MENYNSIIDYVKRLYPNKEFISLHEPRFNTNERKYVLDTIDSTFVSSVGKYVDDFESYLGNIVSIPKAVAVSNGTSALQIALKLVGVNLNDYVITQSMSFVATANAISHVGAEPIFVDVDLDTMGLSPASLTEFLANNAYKGEDGFCYHKTTKRKIAACVPMHTFGFPVHFDELNKICNKWNIPIVEDAAEALGSKYKGIPCGILGTIGVFSFNGNKIVTAGGGGAIVSKDSNIIKHAKHLTTTAKVPHPYEFYHDEIGYNYRMPNLNAALALAQLEQLNEFIIQKRNIAKQYHEFLTHIGVKHRWELPDTTANFWLNCIELEDEEQRNSFLEVTNKNGVMTRPIWKLLHTLPMYANCLHNNLFNSEFLEKRIVNIPSSVPA